MLLVSDPGNGIESFAQFLTVFALFILVLLITFFTTRYVAGISRYRFKGRNIEVIEAQRISANINIQIMRVGRKYYAMTVGRDNVTLIGEISEDDISLPEDTPGPAAGFGRILAAARAKERKK